MKIKKRSLNISRISYFFRPLFFLFAFLLPFFAHASTGVTPGSLISNGYTILSETVTPDRFTLTAAVDDGISSDLFQYDTPFNVTAIIEPNPSFIGEYAPIYVFGFYKGYWYFKSEQGSWVRVDEDNPYLQPFERNRLLSSAEAVAVVRGMTGLTGHFQFYVGYETPSGEDLIYNEVPYQLDVVSSLPGNLIVPENESAKVALLNSLQKDYVDSLQERP
ncbi:hypothetical protein U5801_14030 [Lamprobacter modestohalophilus]|uniref:hypothetical protein n=1 Tax=Lamprobacter modestohalophilus TaxID=1064514 RepID=UPI002ADEB565|nr:hypothetical protein [Lamprobacter modestohalophilus]MEA1050917.1 hypothetical protein [Lamprobacter modestohalophilus]